MSETESSDDDETTLLEASGPRDMTKIADIEPHNLQKAEIMVRIAARTGININPDTPLSKRELNSIHAYLTGKWHYDKRDHGTPMSSSIGALRRAVANEARIEGIPDENCDTDTERAFRKAELAKLLEELEVKNDQRPKPGSRD